MDFSLKRRLTFLFAIFLISLAYTTANDEISFREYGVLTRDDWQATPPIVSPAKLKIHPPPYVIISHTATSFCFTQSQCTEIVQGIQKLHVVSRGWNDIAYNFLVGGDGNVYEGRGWDIEGAHTFRYNVKSIGIAFIGNFEEDKPTEIQVKAAKKFIEMGIETGKIDKDFKLLGHRQCSKTSSPGQVLFDIIKTWEHWSPAP